MHLRLVGPALKDFTGITQTELCNLLNDSTHYTYNISDDSIRVVIDYFKSIHY